MPKKKTIEEIKPAIELGDEYKLLSKEYIEAHSKLEILHKFCGDVFQMSWNNFQQGHKCPGCSGKLKLTIEKIKPAIELGDEYKLLSEEYINAHSKLEILHESCGDVFQMSWDSFNHGHRCPKCWFKNNRGENHGNWNPNLTDKDREQERNFSENREWIKAIFERDGHTCQKCLARGGSLVAHHIFPWALFPKLRFEVENGITLCKECHKRYHSIYGNGLDCNLETIGDHLYLNNRYPSENENRFIENHQHLIEIQTTKM